MSRSPISFKFISFEFECEEQAGMPALPGLRLSRTVHAAFAFRAARPPACSLGSTQENRLRAVCAADAWIPLVVQRIVRKVVFHDVIPHLLLVPTHQRIDLDELPLMVPLDYPRARSLERLVSADCSNPCITARQCIFQRLELSNAAAEIRVRRPELRTELALLLFGSDIRLEFADFNLIAIFELAPQLVGFRKEK